jgi:ketosteroid isomerase-like protein
MKIFSLFLILTALTNLSNASYADEPKEVLAAFHAALATGDQAKATELLAPDVTIYESGYVERSRAEYAGHHLPEDIAFAKTSTSRLLQTKERIEGNLAVIWQETETQAKVKGKKLRLLGTETSVLQRVGDSWGIVHIHWSSRKAK